MNDTEHTVKAYAEKAAADVRDRGIGPHQAAEEWVDQLPLEEMHGLAVDGFAEVIQSVLGEWRRRDREAWEAEHRAELAERKADAKAKAEAYRKEMEQAVEEMVEQRLQQRVEPAVDQYLLDKMGDIIYSGADGKMRSLLDFRPEDALYWERKWGSTAATVTAQHDWMEALGKAFTADPDAAVMRELPASVVEELGKHAVEVWTKGNAQPEDADG